MAPISANRSTVAPRVKTAALRAPPPKVAEPVGGEAKPGKLKTFVNSENPLLPKDGYLDFSYKPLDAGRGQMPTRIKLADGTVATAKEVELVNGQKAFLIKNGQREVLAVPLGNGSGGAMRYFVPQDGASLMTMKPSHAWAMDPSNNLGALFQRATFLANRGDPPVTSPADLASAKKARDIKASAGVAKQVDNLAATSVAAKGKVAEASAKVAAAMKDLQPALRDGTIINRPNAKGEVTFEIARPAEMSSSEHAKLVEKFGDRLDNLTSSARVVEREMNRASALREGNAADLMANVNSGPFLASLEQLPPAARMKKINEISAQVAGTRAGAQLADDLFGKHPGKEGKSMGVLTPSTELGKLIFKDVYKDPAAMDQLKGLSANLSPQFPGDKREATDRLFEVALGRNLTPAEMHASFDLAFAKPEQLETGQGFDKFGDVTDLLSSLGETAERGKNAKLKGAGNSGAAIFGTFQLMRGLADLGKDPSFSTAVTATEDAARAAGAWAGWLAKEGSAFQKVGKTLGIASDVIGLVKDLHGMATASSPDKKYDGFVNSYASALIIAGTLASSVTPWGIAAQVVGLGVKLLRPETSDAYDNAHKTLKQVTKTQAEKDAEAAAAKADYDRRSTRERGNRI